MYEVKVEQIFEGPMDLLVFLIKKNEVDIYDIPIALITDQYLEYLEWLKQMNIDSAGDFIVMAATLAQIKSKMLLPTHGEEEEDPREKLTKPILEYMRIKSVADQLAERNLLGEDIFIREPPREELTITREYDIVKVGLFELIDAFQRILEKLPGDHKVDLTDESISIKDKMNELIEILEKTGTAVLDSLFSENVSKIEMVVTFLAVLEMAKLCLIQINQDIQTGIITIYYL
ncbi:MAG: segregation/condensation protein A [Desulfobacterales bacterium]|nr:segregation/condensation protein A [Desulfobacterales bacterium]